MNSKEIRNIPIPNPSLIEGARFETVALGYQMTKCFLLREIAAQLAEANEQKRPIGGAVLDLGPKP